MFNTLKKFAKVQTRENAQIRLYFAECIETINRENLFMLRKVCMYVSFGFILMPIVGFFVVPGYRFSFAHWLFIPLLVVYFFINLYTRNHEGMIGTNATGNICGTFYLFLCINFILMDTVAFSYGQATWTPMIIVVFPMVFIDRMYKYGIEELIVISLFILLSYINKERVIFSRDLYMITASYILSMLSAHIVLGVRSNEALAIKELKRLSSYDKLTNVLNKGAFLQKIDEYFANKDENSVCAMCVVDLDNFKSVNDNLGHSTGDLLLEKVGNLLLECFRGYDIIGRYGGDEFVVLLPDMDDKNLLEMQCRSLQMFLSDFSVGNVSSFSVSIGAIIDHGNHSSDEVFQMADDALYKSKLDGKNCCNCWIVDKESDSSKPILLAITGKKQHGIENLYLNENQRFEILSAFSENDALCYISQYHRQIKLVMLEMDVDNYGSEKILKYVKSREGFKDIPIIAVASMGESKDHAIKMGANEIFTFDTPNEKFKEAIDKLIGM